MTSPDAVALKAGELEATWRPGAGMVGSSLRHRGEELLGAVRAQDPSGPTFGIPLLYPWANRVGAERFQVAGREVRLPPDAAPVHHDEHGLPIHGLLAGYPAWRVHAAEHRDDRGLLRAEMRFGADLLALYPFPHDLAVDVVVDPGGVEVVTTVMATGRVHVPIAFGWHPYLVLPGVPRSSWVLELPARRHLLTDERGLPTGATERVPAERAPLGLRMFDDAYDELGDPVLAIEGGGRRIAVTVGDGYRVAQVFAPAGDDVVALEPMTAPADALRTGRGLRLLPPEGELRPRFRIDVTDVETDVEPERRAERQRRR
jgi:aldose 1-epimerase